MTNQRIPIDPFSCRVDAEGYIIDSKGLRIDIDAIYEYSGQLIGYTGLIHVYFMPERNRYVFVFFNHGGYPSLIDIGEDDADFSDEILVLEGNIVMTSYYYKIDRLYFLVIC